MKMCGAKHQNDYSILPTELDPEPPDDYPDDSYSEDGYGARDRDNCLGDSSKSRNENEISNLSKTHQVVEETVFTVLCDHTLDYGDNAPGTVGVYTHLPDANAAALSYLADEYEGTDWEDVQEEWKDGMVQITATGEEETFEVSINKTKLMRRIPLDT